MWLIEAYIAITSHGHVFPFGIYEDNKAVVFLMIEFGTDDDWKDALEIAVGNYCLWRLMIDEIYQNMGYGRKAVQLALEFIHTFPVAKLHIAGYPMQQRIQLHIICTIPLNLRQ